MRDVHHSPNVRFGEGNRTNGDAAPPPRTRSDPCNMTCWEIVSYHNTAHPTILVSSCRHPPTSQFARCSEESAHWKETPPSHTTLFLTTLLKNENKQTQPTPFQSLKKQILCRVFLVIRPNPILHFALFLSTHFSPCLNPVFKNGLFCPSSSFDPNVRQSSWSVFV